MIYDSLRLAGLDYDEGPDKGGDVRAVCAEPAPADLQGAGRALVELARPTAASAARSRLRRRARRSRKARMRRTTGRPARGRGPGKGVRPVPFPDSRRGRAAARRASRTLSGSASPRAGVTTFRRSCLRLDFLAQRAARRPGSVEVRRLPDLQLRQRRRRPPDGHHARDARGGVSVLHAQVQPALRRPSAGRSPNISTCRTSSRRAARSCPSGQGTPRFRTSSRGVTCRRRSSTTSRCSAGTRPTTASSSRCRGWSRRSILTGSTSQAPASPSPSWIG